MSEPIKIVDTSSIDMNEELRGLIPESTYYHSVGITQRVHSKFGPYEANLIGDASKSEGTTYTWQIAANPNASLDLNEAYFEIVGKLKVKLNNAYETGTQYTYTVQSDDVLIPSDLWFHSLFNQVQLRIGDANISTSVNPIIHNVFRKLMFHGEEKNQMCGFAGTHALRIKDSDNTISDRCYGGLYNFGNGTGIMSMPLVFGGSTHITEVEVPFSVKMMVQDLFDTDDLIPIFNQAIRITLQRSSLKDVSIQCANNDFSVSVSEFKYFQLNTFSYLLEESNKKMLMKIYDKPRALVFSTKQEVFQTITSKQHGGQVSVNSPSGLLFGAKFVMMYLPKSTTNTNQLPVFHDTSFNKKQALLASASSNITANTKAHRKPITRDVANLYTSLAMGPHCALPINYNTMLIECGGYKVLYDDITPLRMPTVINDTTECGVVPAIYNNVKYTAGTEACYYTRLYHEYCESCMHTGVQPISHEEFINCYPVVMAEISDFSQIATNSFLNIQIQNGEYASENPYQCPYTVDGNTHDQLNIICYGLRALQMSNGQARLMEVNNTVINGEIDDSIQVQ